MNGWIAGTSLLIVALVFAGAGLAYSRNRSGSIEDYITARGTVGTPVAAATLVASGMGAWVLFGPAEAATRGGLPTILGYALGAAAPLLLFIPLGERLRRLMPEGHTLTEYVYHRYGRGMYLFTLLVMLFYMFIFLAAEVTGMALIANLVSGVPLWITALIVVGATLTYTTYGGLQASIFTDAVQTLLILPLLALIVVAGYLALGGIEPAAGGSPSGLQNFLSGGAFPALEAG